MADLVRQLNRHWSISLGDEFQGRFDGKFLLFVVPGRTVLVSIWNSGHARKPGELLAGLKRMAYPEPVESYQLPHPILEKFGYLLLESDEEKGARWALYTFCVASQGYLQLTFYFDDKQDLDWAREIWKSAQFEPT